MTINDALEKVQSPQTYLPPINQINRHFWSMRNSFDSNKCQITANGEWQYS